MAAKFMPCYPTSVHMNFCHRTLQLATKETVDYKRRIRSLNNSIISCFLRQKIFQELWYSKNPKPGNKVRPTGTIGYETSRALADIQSLLVGGTGYHVKNSKHLISEVLIEEDEIFNSHDVVSLFTNMLIFESLNIIKGRLKERTLLSPTADDNISAKY